MRLIFDITALKRWKRPPVGMIRVELEIAKYILRHFEQLPCIFVCCEGYKNALTKLQKYQVVKLIDGIEKRQGTHYLLQSVQRIWAMYQYAGMRQCMNKILRSIYPKLLPGWATQTVDDVNQPRINFEIKQGDIWLSNGLYLDQLRYSFYCYIKQTYALSFIGISHDLIPITHPEYVAYPDATHFYKKNFIHLNKLFNKICFDSDFSKLEFQRIAKEHGISKLPILKTIPLGVQSAMTRADNICLSNITVCKDYVLFVSTVEIRKNHIVLLKAWLAAHEQSIAMPKLICVGMKGWGIDELFSLYQNSQFLQDKILFLDRVNDVTLVELYKNCLFTVFPSHVEGFGLGAAESLGYGKICVVSTAAALAEATQYLMPRIEPNDVDGWIKIITYLAQDTDERARLELKIKQEFHPKSWETFAKEFIDFAIDKN